MSKKWMATFQNVYFTGKLNGVQRKDGRFAVIDNFGREKFVLPEDTISIGDFSDGVFPVVRTGCKNVYYMDETGKVVLELPTGMVGYKFVKGIARVLNLETRRYGYINKKAEEIISLPPSVKLAYDFSEDLALIEKDKAAVQPGKSNFAFIDETGKEVIDFADDVYMVGSFRNGVAINKHKTDSDTWTDLIDKTGKHVDPPKSEKSDEIIYTREYLNDDEVALKDEDGLFMVDPSDKQNYVEAIKENAKYVGKVPEEIFGEISHVVSEQIDFFEFLKNEAKDNEGKGK